MTPEEIVRELQRTLPVFEEEAHRAMDEAVDLTYQRKSELAPKGATGKLAPDITHVSRVNQTGVTGTVRARAKYAQFLDEGSGVYAMFQGPARGLLGVVQAGPHHLITPKPGRGPRAALKFSDGSFRRSAKGTPATHFIDRTRTQTEVEVEDTLTNGAVRADRRLFP